MSEELYQSIVTADLSSKDACVDIIRLIKSKLLERQLERSERSPTADQLVDFLKYGFDIKETERRGWRLYGLEGTETVACHMYRMALMAMVIEKTDLDMNRCIQMALVHDLAEAIVGDITPECGVSRKEKHRLELEAMNQIAGSMSGSNMSDKIKFLWLEYEEGKSAESLFVHDIDKLELALQTMEYERKNGIKLDQFFRSAEERIRDPFFQEILSAIRARRP